MTQPGSEPRSPGPLVNTLTPRPMEENGGRKRMRMLVEATIDQK